MTVCPSRTAEVIITAIILIIVNTLVICFVNKKWKSKKKITSVLVSIAIFIILSLLIIYLSIRFYIPDCGSFGVRFSVPFEFYAENGTCKYNEEVINNTYKCEYLQSLYLKQIERGTTHEGYIIEYGP